jgi:hypothetical protein
VQIQESRLGTQMDLDTGKTLPWSPGDRLVIEPHGCTVLAWEENPGAIVISSSL